MANESGPIADLTYRTYDGKLDPPKDRWKVIAMNGVRTALKQNGRFWFFSFVFSYWYYIVIMIALYVMGVFAQSMGGQGSDAISFLSSINWDDQFIQGFGQGSFAWLFVAMAFASGAIANDNRSNAMLVYLSKPCTKRDYLVGKWFGVWIPLTGFMLVPSLTFYIYGAFNYRDLEFLAHDPYLIVKLILGIAICSAFFTSISLGISSLFREGRLAKATLAGVFFFPWLFVRVMSIIMEVSNNVDTVILERLAYLSIDRITTGLLKLLLDSDGAQMMGDEGPFVSGPPEVWQAYGMIFGISALCIYVAWRRIRAVEVVA